MGGQDKYVHRIDHPGHVAPEVSKREVGADLTFGKHLLDQLVVLSISCYARVLTNHHEVHIGISLNYLASSFDQTLVVFRRRYACHHSDYFRSLRNAKLTLDKCLCSVCVTFFDIDAIVN